MAFEFEGRTLKSYTQEPYETVVDVTPGITYIARSAFANCTNIEEIILPDGVTEIAARAFSGCTKLKRINLPDSLAAIGMSAFENCTALEEIVIPQKIRGINTSVFSGCSALERVVLHKGISVIESSAFRDCTKLKSVENSEGIQSIGGWAFQNCAALENIELPENGENIGVAAFDGCKQMMEEKNGLWYLKGTSILYKVPDNTIKCVIPDDVTIIAARCFMGCNVLKKVVIGGSVSVIGEAAFYECKMLSEVVLSEGLIEIGANVFEKCAKLSKIEFPASLQKIGGSAFAGCKKIQEVVIGVKEINYSTFNGCESLTSVTLKEGVEKIYRGAFEGCKKLKEITFPKSIKAVYERSFTDCKLIKKFEFPEGMTALECAAFAQAGGAEEVYIPASVKELSWGMWGTPEGSKNLRYVEIGGKVDFEQRAYFRNRAGAVWEMLKAFETAAVCLLHISCDEIPAAVRKRAAIGYAEGVMRGAAIGDDFHAGYLAYIKKNKSKLIDEAASYPGLVRLMMREKLIATDKMEMLLKAFEKDEQMVAELNTYSDANFSAAQKEKSKAKAKSGDDARAQRLRDADAGKGGLTFASDVDFGSWNRGTSWGNGQTCFANKAELEQFLGKRGMKLAASMTAKVDLLLIQNNVSKKATSAKMEKAKTMGIPTITEKELLAKKDLWPELDRTMSADGKTYTIDASADFDPNIFTGGKIPADVEVINLSAVAVARGLNRLSFCYGWVKKKQFDSLPRPDAETAAKIVFTDLKKINTKDDAHLHTTGYAYFVVGRTTLDEYTAMMNGRSGEMDMLAEIFGTVSPINDDTPVSEEAIEGIKLKGLAKDALKLLVKTLLTDRKKKINLTYSASGNPVSKEAFMLLLASLTGRTITLDEKYPDKKDATYKCTKAMWQTIGSKEMQLLSLIDRDQLRKTVADLFSMTDGAPYVDVQLAQVAAIKLCDVDAAKGMMATLRDLERKHASFGVSDERWCLMKGIQGKLGANEDKDVLMYLDKVKHLDWAAEARGVSEEELRAELLGNVDLGLDENNGIVLDYGPRRIRAELLTDLTFTFVDLSKNKIVRTLPKTGKSDDVEKAGAAQAEFKRIRDQIKTMSTIYLNKVKEMYYQGTSMKKDKWAEMFMASQISLRMAHGVLWGVFDKADTLKTAFCVQGDKCCDINGEEISIRKDALIGVVDLAQLDPIARSAWRKYFSQDEIPQPVKQVWQPLCMISIKDAEKRYMGCHIESGILQGLGWDIYAYEQDTCVHSDYIIAEVDYWSRHGSISGSGKVTRVSVEIKHDIDEMTDHEKRLWNQSVQKLDYYLHPEGKAEDAIRSGDVSQVREWVECGLISADNLSDMIKVSTDASKVEVTAYLLELSREMMPASDGDEDDEWTL